MKIAILVFALFGLTMALPPKPANELVDATVADTRFVDILISEIIERISIQMKENGLDPLLLDGFGVERISLPVPSLFDLSLNVDDIRVDGISEIVINQISFGILSLRLTMDITLPEILISIRHCAFNISLLGSNANGDMRNVRLAVREVGIAGDLQLSIFGGGGLTTAESNLFMKLERIMFVFTGHVNMFGRDYTSDILNFVNVMIPNRLRELSGELDELVNIVATQLIDSIL